MYRHYIEVNQDSYITKAFSNAFESPTTSSICINKNGSRAFQLVLTNKFGGYSKKWENGQIVDAEENVEQVRQLKIVAVKHEAAKRILADYPEWKQRNLDVESLLLRNKSQTETLTAQETAIINQHVSMRDTIKAIRDKSDEIETSLTKLNLIDLKNFNPQESSLWT